MLKRIQTVAKVTAIVMSDALYATGFHRLSRMVDSIVVNRRP